MSFFKHKNTKLAFFKCKTMFIKENYLWIVNVTSEEKRLCTETAARRVCGPIWPVGTKGANSFLHLRFEMHKCIVSICSHHRRLKSRGRKAHWLALCGTQRWDALSCRWSPSAPQRELYQEPFGCGAGPPLFDADQRAVVLSELEYESCKLHCRVNAWKIDSDKPNKGTCTQPKDILFTACFSVHTVCNDSVCQIETSRKLFMNIFTSYCDPHFFWREHTGVSNSRCSIHYITLQCIICKISSHNISFPVSVCARLSKLNRFQSSIITFFCWLFQDQTYWKQTFYMMVWVRVFRIRCTEESWFQTALSN